MGNYTQILYQIIFSTKHRGKTLEKSGRKELFKFIWGILKNNKCHLYRLNGVEDHIHILISLHPTIALSNLIKDIKLASTSHIKESKIFKNFNGWQEGFSAFTYTIDSKDNLIEYIKNQEEHHKKFDYKEELIKLLKEHGVDFDEKYFK
jgi:putative transposase